MAAARAAKHAGVLALCSGTAAAACAGATPPDGRGCGRDRVNSHEGQCSCRLLGKRAFITGAARGLGLGIAVELAKAGAHVALNDLPANAAGLRAAQSRVAAAHAECRAVHGQANLRSVVAPADVTDSDAVERAVKSAAADLGGLDVCVANAGINLRGPFIADDTAPGGPRDFMSTFNVVCLGPVHTLYHAARAMLQSHTRGEGGRLIIIGSVMGSIILGRDSPAYSLCKAGLPHFARVLAADLGEFGITVNTISPGWMDTPGERKFASDDEIHDFGRRIPGGRIGSPADVGKVVAFLASADSAYITGADIRVDGGFTVAMLPQPDTWARYGDADPTRWRPPGAAPSS